MNTCVFFISMANNFFPMLIMVQKKNDEYQAHIFKDNYFESCSKDQLARAYHFEHKNHGLHVIFLF